MKSLLIVIIFAVSFSIFADESNDSVNSLPVKCRVTTSINNQGYEMSRLSEEVMFMTTGYKVGIIYLSFNEQGELLEHILRIKGYYPKSCTAKYINGKRVNDDTELLKKKFEEKLNELQEMGICE